MHKNTLTLNRAKGNTILEYVLIGVLVLTAGVFAMMAFGKNFQQQLADAKTEFKDHANQAAFIEAKAQAEAAMASVTTNTKLNGLGSTGTDRGTTDQTTGANGDRLNTGILGDTGKTGDESSEPVSQTDQLKALLKDLANQAHKIAQLQALLETISAYSSGDMTKFQSTSVYFEGRVVNAYQLSYALTHGGEIIELENTKNQILASSASDSLKDEIVSLTDNVKESAVNTGSQAQYGSVNDGASTETNKTAAQICDKSGGKDNGKKCDD
jgi:hypothetical protein